MRAGRVQEKAPAGGGAVKTCPWWIRWYHRRRRRRDERVLVPRLVRGGMRHLADAYYMWGSHRRSATHWQCGCAEVEVDHKVDLIEQAMFSVWADRGLYKAEMDRCEQLAKECIERMRARRERQVGS